MFFTKKDDGYWVTGLNIKKFSGNTIIIPFRHKGNPVVGVDKEAFCTFLFSDIPRIEKVIVEEGITMIGEGAFCNSVSLKDVVLPKNLTIIGEGAFENCSSLHHIIIPDNVEIIPENAFLSCEELRYVILPKKLKEIKTYAFLSVGDKNGIKIWIPKSNFSAYLHVLPKCSV